MCRPAYNWFHYYRPEKAWSWIASAFTSDIQKIYINRWSRISELGRRLHDLSFRLECFQRFWVKLPSIFHPRSGTMSLGIALGAWWGASRQPTGSKSFSFFFSLHFVEYWWTAIYRFLFWSFIEGKNVDWCDIECDVWVPNKLEIQ